MSLSSLCRLPACRRAVAGILTPHAVRPCRTLHAGADLRFPDDAKKGPGGSPPVDTSSSSSPSSSSSSSDDEKSQAKPSPLPGKRSEEEAKSKLKSMLQGIRDDRIAKAKQQEEGAAATLELKKPRKRAKAGARAARGVEPELVEATGRVAHHLEPHDPAGAEAVESDLLKQLRSVAWQTDKARTEGEPPGAAAGDIKSLFDDIKVQASSPKEKSDLSSRRQLTDEQLQFIERRKKLRRDSRRKEERTLAEELAEPIDVLGAPPLGIFPPGSLRPGAVREEEVEGPPEGLETWGRCLERHLAIRAAPRPRNFLEEMAQMTERGIMWRFPIDNEQGLDPEQMEPFHEHVFLERHLEPWCPPRGPVRHFMELVCVGLQRNPYVTAAKKREHLEWFREYFGERDRAEALRLSGALGNDDLLAEGGKAQQG